MTPAAARMLAVFALALADAANAAAPDRLSQLPFFAKQTRYEDGCRDKVAMEWARSYPIPAPPDVTPRFRLLYRPSSSTADPGTGWGADIVMAPVIVAEFDLETGETMCSLFKGSFDAESGGSYGPRFAPAAARLDFDAFDRKESELYEAIEKAGAAYLSGRKDKEAKAAARAFMKEFLFLSEPGLRDFYYDLNPDFWDWIGRLCGIKLKEQGR